MSTFGNHVIASVHVGGRKDRSNLCSWWSGSVIICLDFYYIAGNGQSLILVRTIFGVLLIIGSICLYFSSDRRIYHMVGHYFVVDVDF